MQNPADIPAWWPSEALKAAPSTEVKLGLDPGAPVVERLRQAPFRLMNIGDIAGSLMAEAAAEIERLSERLSTCEIYLATWDEEREATYWSQYGIPKPPR